MGTELARTDDHDYGPAMSALNELQRRFVDAMLITGGQAGRYSEAARMAGYTGNPDSLKVTAHRLAHSPKVQAAIREEAERRVHSGAILGASVLIEIAQDSQHKDRFKAATRLLDMAGLIVTTQHKVTVEHTGDDAEKIRSVIAMAKAMGMDPRKLLGNAGVTAEEIAAVDAEFEVVEHNWLEDAV